MSIVDKAKRAVENYVRSVVYIDDEAYLKDGKAYQPWEAVPVSAQCDSEPTAQAAEPGYDNVHPVVASETTETNLGAVDDNDDELCISKEAYAIQSGFAALDMVCGVYQPGVDEIKKLEDGAQVDSCRLYRMCLKADLFVVDWKFSYEYTNTRGENERRDVPCKALFRAFKHDIEAGSVRFCVIYSREAADQVMSQVAEVLGVEWNEGMKARIDVEGWTILFLPKKDGVNTDGCKPIDVPKRIINAVAEQNQGIARRYALEGFATIRNNANRVLKRFANKLDAEMALHCAMTCSEGSICEELAMLLASEIRSVLEDATKCVDRQQIYEDCRLVLSRLSANAYKNFVDKTADVTGAEDDLRKKVSDLFAESTAAIAFRKLCNKNLGCETGSGLSVKRLKLLDGIKDLICSLGNVDFGALSELYAMRAFYGEERVVRLGTVVKVADKFFVCIMPACDCRRLKRDTNFMFWELEDLPEGNYNVMPRAGHAFVVREGKDLKSLLVTGKMAEKLRIITFTPSNCLVRIVEESGSFKISGKMNGVAVDCLWVGELKLPHAMRIVKYANENLGRVGLSENDWLRLRVTK